MIEIGPNLQAVLQAALAVCLLAVLYWYLTRS